MTSVLLKNVQRSKKRRWRSTCWYKNRLPLLCVALGLFWCGLAVLMICLYARLVQADLPFITEKPKQISPCYLYFCPFGATCRVDEETMTPMCVCERKCSKIFAPVCGTDMVTYSNLCMLERASCIHNKLIKVKSHGVCGVRDPCEGHVCKFGAECLPSQDGERARCQCPNDCPSYGDHVGSQQICGNDGKDYANMCEMRKAACYQLKDIRIKYHGKCDPCQGHTCEAPKLCQVGPAPARKPECRCSYVCPTEINLVCGTDGRTYSNQCLLRKQACKSRADIRVLYNGKCSPDNNPCSKVTCGPEAECSVDRNGRASCVCPPQCEPVLRRVCGNDSVTYDNECELRRRSCEEKVYVSVKHPGQCGSDSVCLGHFCDYGAVCVDVEGRPQCECPQCTEEYEPVCGDNGITYENKCKLRQENCQREEDVQVEKKGTCDGCGQTRCEFYAVCESLNGHHRCICPTTCVQVDAPVCGNDGVTYSNECELRVESCRMKKFLTITSTGTCDKCRGVTCEFHAKCENGRCICPILCPTVHEPVCGTDGQTYVNECEMRKSSCAKSNMVEVDRFGECDGDSIELSGSGEVCDCNSMGSYSTTCDPRTKQCTCKPGVGGKRCDRCDIGYWGLHRIGESGNAGCIPCSCNKLGSDRDDCDQMTGRCVCKPLITGMKCDLCQNGNILGVDGCRDTFMPDTCSEVDCLYGATCRKERSRPVCVCEHVCDSDSEAPDIVCGSDGQNYGSECQLELFGCRLQKLITVAHYGACKGAPPTPQTTSSPVTKSRKTTRHIEGGDQNPDPFGNSKEEKDGDQSGEVEKCNNIDELCLKDQDCCASFSHCHNGLCNCFDGYIPSLDNSECFEVKTKPPEKVDNTTNACSGRPCFTGECILDDLLGFRCACPLGMSGPLCNEDMDFSTPSFSGRSFLTVPLNNLASQDISIDIIFSTLNKDGIILFASKHPNGTGDFISLAMNDGFVEFRYDLGGGPAILRSKDPVEPSRSHRVIARRMAEVGILIVDNDDAITGSSPATHTSLDLTDPLMLGYHMKGTKEVFARIGVDLGLVGCIHQLKLGGEASMYSYNLALFDERSDVGDGVDITECGKNPCKSMPCLNGATCLVLDAQIFECRCKVGYKGILCENLVDPCASEPCQYGGTCVATSSSEGFFCQCTHGREGLRCERESMPEVFVPQFTGDSYMELPLEEKLSMSMSVTVWFKSLKPDGVILFVTQEPGGNGDFVCLTVERKKLVFSFFLGSGTAKIESKKHIHLDKWHKVTIRRSGRSGQMTIDGHPPISGEATSLDIGGSSSMLNIDDRPLYLGGFMQKEDLPSGLSVDTGFTGAIQRVIINGRTIDGLMSTAVAMRNISTYNGPPCNVNPCMNGGVCVPMLNLADCRCPANYMGERCEKRYEQVDKDLPLLFDKMTYLSYPNEVSRKQEGQRSNQFAVTFRTSEPDGILLLQIGGDQVTSDYLSVAVSGGHLELSYNLGKQGPGNLHIIRSAVDVTDGKWHTVKVFRQEREGSLQVDDEDPVTGFSEQGTKQLDTDGLLWIGGRSSLPWGLPTMKNFEGCIEKVEVNGQRLHLVEDKNGHSSTIAFCS